MLLPEDRRMLRRRIDHYRRKAEIERGFWEVEQKQNNDHYRAMHHWLNAESFELQAQILYERLREENSQNTEVRCEGDAA